MPNSLLPLPLLCVVALVCSTATATAAVRYSAPGASTAATCDSGDPCAIQTAIVDAGAGDEVVVTPGTYAAVPDVFATAASLHIHGAYGHPAPVLELTPPAATFAIQLSGGLSHVDHLRIEQSGNSVALSAQTGSLLEDLAIHSTVPGAEGLYLNSSGTLRSVVRDVAIDVPGTALDLWKGNYDVRNATLRATRALNVYNTSGSRDITVRNSILFGGSYDVDVSSTTATTVDIDNSRFSYGHKDSVTATITDGPHDTALVPIFADAAGHEAHDSPTIDAGATDILTNPADLDGTARPLGAQTDMGAYEFRTPALATTGAADAISFDSAALHGAVDPQGETVSWRIAFGTTTAYGSATPSTTLAATTGLQGVVATAGPAGGLPALAAATTYHYRVETVDAYGAEVDGADQSFTTTAAPFIAPIGLLLPKHVPVAKKKAPRCVVPSLRGRTLAQAKTRLRKAHCALGKVRRRGSGKLVVRSQGVKAGTRHSGGAHVPLVLAAPRHHTKS